MRLRGIVVVVALAVALVVLAVVASRDRDRPSGLPECVRYVPHDAAFVLMVPSIKEAMQQQAKLLARFRKHKVFASIWEQFGRLAVQALGFDPTRPATLDATGLDPLGGVVAAISADGQESMVALAVTNREAMERSLRGRVTQMNAAAKFETRNVSGFKMTVVKDQALAWGYHGYSVVISLGTADGKSAEHVARLVGLKENIGADKIFKEMLGKVRDQQVVVFINGDSVGRRYNKYRDRRARVTSKKANGSPRDPAKELSSYFRGGILGIGASGKRVEIKTFLGVPQNKSGKLVRLMKGKGRAPPLGRYILPNAVTAARGSLDLRMLVDWLEARMDPKAQKRHRLGVKGFEQETGIKEQNLYGLLAGRYALGLFAPSQGAMVGGGPLLYRLVQGAGGVLLVQVTDAQKAASVLERLAKAWQARGVELQAKPRGGGKQYCYRHQDQCLVSWAVAKNLVVISSSRHLAASVKLVEQGGESLLNKVKSSHARSTFRKDEGMIWYLDLYQTATLMKKISPPGMLALAHKMYAQPASALLSMFSDLAYTVEPGKDGVTGRLVITLK